MKKYTLSTMIFDSKEEALEQVKGFYENGILRKGTRIMEVVKVFKPKKMVKWIISSKCCDDIRDERGREINMIEDCWDNEL